MNTFLYLNLFYIFNCNFVFICAYQPMPPPLLKQFISNDRPTVVTSVNQNITKNTNLENQRPSHLENKNHFSSEVVKHVGLSEGGIVINEQNNPEHYKEDLNEQNNPEHYKEDLKNNDQSVGILDNPISEEKLPTKSSIVPRKGAPTIDLNLKLEDKTNITLTKQTSYNLPNNTNKAAKNNDLKNNLTHGSANHLAIVSKKPVSASDFTEDDADTFIESSSTGKDYVLTGVAIFICLWAVIFGALFFYKRAGELWDRRHYRRMDFLVEGMYND